MKQTLRILLLLFCLSLNAQEKNSKNPTPQDNFKLSATETHLFQGNFQSLSPQILKQVATFKLEKNKVLHLVTDTTQYYFLVDTSSLSSEFEKMYFYKTCVKDLFSIQIEHGLPSNTAWIISTIKNSAAADRSKIELLLKETKTVSSKMSSKEKTIYLSNN